MAAERNQIAGDATIVPRRRTSRRWIARKEFCKVMTLQPARLVEKLKSHPFLCGLERRQLELLGEAAMEVDFNAQEVIFQKGDPANRFYLIQSGAVVIGEPGGFPFQIVHSGEVIGWSAMFPPYASHFDARALEKTRAIFFYGSWVLEKCETDHDLGYELMKRMGAVLVDRLQARRKAVPPPLRAYAHATV
jgi:CRP/FNR family transcriptional regulator, cyclic AMP receptor protein